MSPSGNPAAPYPTGIETIGPPSAVNGTMKRGSPVRTPSGATSGAAGKTSASRCAFAVQNRSRGCV
jgi:hypothetical protein